jgi:Ser/Thr protein kinase RdoA (MazF antagonist)
VEENVTRPLTPEELLRVLGHYDLGALRDAQRVERGFINENWRLETTQGQYFLKRRHPDLRDPNVIHAQHALMMYLRHVGFPAPPLLPTIEGDTLLIRNGEFYEIQGCIEGIPYDHERRTHFEAAARTLGRYHTLVQGFVQQSLCESEALYSPAVLRQNLDDLADAWELAQDITHTYAETVQRIEAHADDLMTRFGRHGELPHLIIHGDYYAGNLLFDKEDGVASDDIVSVVDYDKARWQPRVVELAEALIYFASPRPGHLKHLVYPGFLEWDRFALFLHHYASEATLSEREAHALPDYIRCIWLQVSLQRLWEKGKRPPETQEALREVLALGDWAEANTEKMIELCGHVIRDPCHRSSKKEPYDQSHHL